MLHDGGTCNGLTCIAVPCAVDPILVFMAPVKMHWGSPIITATAMVVSQGETATSTRMTARHFHARMERHASTEQTRSNASAQQASEEVPILLPAQLCRRDTLHTS